MYIRNPNGLQLQYSKFFLPNGCKFRKCVHFLHVHSVLVFHADKKFKNTIHEVFSCVKYC